jgi:hypothetical protein
MEIDARIVERAGRYVSYFLPVRALANENLAKLVELGVMGGY